LLLVVHFCLLLLWGGWECSPLAMGFLGLVCAEADEGSAAVWRGGGLMGE
jgi:hypothetical protein